MTICLSTKILSGGRFSGRLDNSAGLGVDNSARGDAGDSAGGTDGEPEGEAGFSEECE